MNYYLIVVVALTFAAFIPSAAFGSSATNRFQFRFPQPAAFRVEANEASGVSSQSLPSTVPQTGNALTSVGDAWLKAWPDDGSTNFVEFGSRVVLQFDAPASLGQLTNGSALHLARTIRSNLFVFQAQDARAAMQEAQRLAGFPGVGVSYPVMRRQIRPDDQYAQRSNDPFFSPYFNTGLGQRVDSQWYLENIDWDGTRLGLDLNLMAAWPVASGAGVTVAVADTGVDMNHPELVARLAGAPHFNFSGQGTDTGPYGGGQYDQGKELWTHATSVAGLIAAEANNGRGMSGVAPQAHIASWVIFTTNLLLVSDEALMDAYEFSSNTVSIQNHSWGFSGTKMQGGPTPLEQAGIDSAVTSGRQGLGTVMVRSAGNDRSVLANACDDGYPNSPQSVAVAAVTQSGRATEYSEPGACILVGAPGGEGNGVNGKQGLLTLDLVGSARGVNSGINYAGDLADYRWGVQGFSGTSASVPLVSGVAALVLSANTNLSYRDVQQILLLSARQWDLEDPGLVTNGAGLMVSHNVGFGVPDAGEAVRLARLWSNRPPATTIVLTDNEATPIPDDGLRVEVSGDDIPSELSSLSCLPGFGPHADTSTPPLRLVDVGLATNVLTVSLTNKAALIARGTNTFSQKLDYAAQAGAAFAIIYNYPGDDSMTAMLNTEYTAIPAVFVANSSGEALKAVFQTNNSALARIGLQSAERSFDVSDSLLCEHVGVRVQTDHPLRGDLRITLISPAGTRSVLQHYNDDVTPGPVDWTYWSTHHFFESSAGRWTVAVSDEAAGNTGSLLGVSLVIRGTASVDTDRDGLDDTWELAHFGSLSYGPKDDPDHDGFNNLREQLSGTNPLEPDQPFAVDITPWQLWGNQRMRLSWPSAPANLYEVWGGTNANSFNLLTNVSGQPFTTEWFAPRSGIPQQFFQLRRTSR